MCNHQRDLGVVVDETLKLNSIMRAIKAPFIDVTPTFFFIDYVECYPPPIRKLIPDIATEATER